MPTFETTFARAAAEGVAGRWSFVGAQEEPQHFQGALHLRSGTDTQAVWQYPIDAERTTHVSVRFAELPAGSGAKLLHLLWQNADQDAFTFDPERSLSVPYASAVDGEVLFSVLDRPAWKGDLRALALDLNVEGRLAIASIRGWNLGPPLSRWLKAHTSADRWSPSAVEVERERRPALWVAPRSRTSQRLKVEPGAILDLGFALHPLSAALATSRTRFSVSVRVDGALELLARHDLPRPGDPPAGRWHSAQIELGRFANREVELLLETEPLVAAGSDFDLDATERDSATALPLWSEPRVRHPPARGERATELSNLLLISIDTLRADHLESYGYGRETSPTVSALASAGVRFTDCRSHAPSTLPSHAALFTGVPAHAEDLGVGLGRRLADARETLAELLRSRGFATAAFVGGAFFDPSYGLSQGFDTYAYARTGALMMDHSDIVGNVDGAIRWLERNADRRVFLFLHSYEVHAPFEPRDEYLEGLVPAGVRTPMEASFLETNVRHARLRSPAFEGWRDFVIGPEPVGGSAVGVVAGMRASYDSEIRATDEELARLLHALDRLGLSEDTLVVFTSDHGESFLEHGRTGHGHLYEDNLRVPLILRFPRKLPANTTVEERVQLIDVVPTCLELLGLDPSELGPVGLDPLKLGSGELGSGELGPVELGPGPEAGGLSLVPYLSAAVEPPPRVSVAFDPVSGLSFTSPAGEKLIVNLGPTHPEAGRRELYLLERDPREEHDRWPRLSAARRQALEAQVHEVLAELPGVHIELHGIVPVSFAGVLQAESPTSSIAEGLRVFPLERSWVGIESDRRVRIESEPSERWLVHWSGAGRILLSGRVYDANGREAELQEAFGAQELLRAPVTRVLEDAEGRAIARLVVRVGGPSWAHSPAATPSSETLEQLRSLGY